jgi:N utilization substance protein B
LALFEIDQTDHPPAEALATGFAHEEIERSGGQADFAGALVQGVLDNKARIDEIITETASAWPLDQMAVTDRVALEIGVYEACIEGTVPLEVAINEAVELAKTFGGENSAGFVNAVLRTTVEGMAGAHAVPG